jgi:hypothetical protein
VKGRQRSALLAGSGALATVPKKWGARGALVASVFSPIRTTNRIRSPSLAGSGQHGNVGKGSRQISSVTLGKGMALRVGRGGPAFWRNSCGRVRMRLARRLGTCVERQAGRGCAWRNAGRARRWARMASRPRASLPPRDERPTQNCNGQGESDCLIKTKQSDGRCAVLTLCDFCSVLILSSL